MKTPLTFAKIVATPTLTAWSQAYNAGNLAAIVSLSLPQNAEQTELSLPLLGKELLNTLEAEYFTLEIKNLETIKKAVEATCEKVPDEVALSFGLAVIIENVIYLCLFGSGKILMKRGDKLGVLLEQEDSEKLITGSGYIENGDILVLQTQQFVDAIPTDMLLSCLSHDKLSEMPEIFSPLLHKKQEGGAGAIAFSYMEGSSSPAEEPPLPETPVSREMQDSDKDQDTEKKSKPMRLPKISLSHSRRLFLTIALIIIIVFAASIMFSIKKQKQKAIQDLYSSTVAPAQKKYDEAQSLMDLNKNLARDDFQSAKDMLKPAIGKFPKNSSQDKQTTDLMQKIDSALTTASQINSADAKPVDATESEILSALIKHTDAKYATIDDTNVYVADNNGITAIAKSNQKETTIIKNKGDWTDFGGFGTYLGNFYVVDKKGGILKYVATSGNNFSKTNYFSDSVPDLTKANGIAIDGSIWIIFSDGNLAKFTKGKADDFSIKGLDKPFVNPSRIFTSVDAQNVYILDTGNQRIVILDKNGNYLAQYQSNIIANAQDFDVVEKDKKIFLLNSGKVYEMDIK